MLKIGITGGIGSGKTIVCRLFSMLGVPVYFSDERAKRLYQDEALRKRLSVQFGEDVLAADGSLDRKVLSQKVFADPGELKKLNDIVHPLVRQDFEQWTQEQNSASYVLKEAAIMFESGAFTQVKKVIAVMSPLELRIERAMRRDAITREEVERRIAAQLPEDERIKRSDYIIHNDEKHFLMPQVLDIHARILADK